MRLLLHLLPVVGVFLVTGCSGRPAPPEKPSFDAAAAGQTAIEMYDADGNGKLDAAELPRCPALQHALPRADADGDGALTADEIADRITHWFNSGTTMMDASSTVALDGRPLAGAEVVLEPEEFLGEGFKVCRGTTDESGWALVTGSDAKYPGVYVGAYRVRISKVVDGKETLPARYNTQSELGVEVADDVPDLHEKLDFRLTSR